jgi:hypothetical protein
VLAQAFFTSKNQQIPGAGATENFFVEGVWHERRIQFSSNVAQSKTTNKASISGDLQFLNDRLQIVFNKSNVNVLGKSWTIAPNNSVEINGTGNRFHKPEACLRRPEHEHKRPRFPESGTNLAGKSFQF